VREAAERASTAPFARKLSSFRTWIGKQCSKAVKTATKSNIYQVEQVNNVDEFEIGCKSKKATDA
jgi:hypothetical protein